MHIYFDTEFTGLHKNTTLISIGLIDENDRTFYAEFTDYDESQCDKWIKDNVIKHLKWKKKDKDNQIMISTDFQHYDCYGNKQFIKDCLGVWLSQYNEVQLVSDCCHYDMVLFIDLFGRAQDLPENVCPVCIDINQDIAKYYNLSCRDTFDKSRESIIADNPIKGDKHNALYDAKVIKAMADKICTGLFYMAYPLS